MPEKKNGQHQKTEIGKILRPLHKEDGEKIKDYVPSGSWRKLFLSKKVCI